MAKIIAVCVAAFAFTSLSGCCLCPFRKQPTVTVPVAPAPVAAPCCEQGCCPPASPSSVGY